MDIRKLQRLIVDALEDVKGADIRVFNSTGLTQLFDRVIIASGTSNRQTKALAASVRDKVKSAGGMVVGVEGEETGEWVLVDLGDAIVHIMQPSIRAYYHLEEIWGGKPVSMKASDEGAPHYIPASPKRVPSKNALPSSAAVRPAVKQRVSKKAAAKPLSKNTAVKNTAVKKVAVKKVAVKKVAAKSMRAARKPAASA